MAYEESAEHHFKLPDQKNKFKNKNTFRIKVLTHPSAFSGPAAALTAFKDPNSSPNEARSDGPASKYVFMGRILDPEMGHHRFLQDPCDISTISSKENAEHAALLTVLHAKIIMSTKSHVPSFKVGDYIIAEAFPGDNNMIFDLQHMRFTQVDDVFSGDYSTTQCEDLATLMVNGMDDYVGYLSDYGDPQIGNYIGTKGKQEVENGLIPAGLIGKTSTGDQLLFDVVAEFDKLAEAFKVGTGVSLSGGGYRSYENQVKVYDNPEKWRLRPDLKEKCTNPGVGDCVHMGATPGTSNHGWGMAFDWDTKDKDGKIEFESKTYDWMLKNAPKYGWEVPSFAQKGGSKEEAWHIEYVNKDKFITNIRDAPTDTDEADAAS